MNPFGCIELTCFPKPQNLVRIVGAGSEFRIFSMDARQKKNVKLENQESTPG